MLTRIGDALGGWTPRAGASSPADPLVAIRGAWPALVGADVARAARPVAIQLEALIVVTSSSAWSHQLTFLEPEIVRGIRALPAGRGIARLRFRVGTIRSQAREAMPPPALRARRRAGESAPPPTRTAADALARFRATVERSRTAHAARGGAFCATCAVAIEHGTACRPCADGAARSVREACERLLYEAPWLRPEDVLAGLPALDAAGYDAIRRRLLRSWWDEMALARARAALRVPVAPDRGRLRRIASSYVLLETKIDPNRLEMDSPVRRNALGDLYDFIRAVELGVPYSTRTRRESN